jgi:hypothetical protein
MRVPPHLNAALLLFEATCEAVDLPLYVDLNHVLRRRETTKICMDVCRRMAVQHLS